MTTEPPENPTYAIASGALDYAVLTTPFPLQAGPPSGGGPSESVARMNVVVSAPPGDPVACARIVTHIPVGEGATSLVETADGITATPPEGWSQETTVTGNTVSVTFTPPGEEFVFDQDGATLVVDGLRINREPGHATIRFMEHLTGESQPTPVTLPLEKWPYRPPVDAGSPHRFSARRWSADGGLNSSPATEVTAGQRVVLAWQFRDGVERHLFTRPLDADMAGQGQDVSTLSRVDSEPVVRATTFTLRTRDIATGETVYDTVTVTVATPRFAALRVRELAAGSGGTVTFPEGATVSTGLTVQGTVTANAGLTAGETVKVTSQLVAEQGITVDGEASAGGASTVAGGEVVAGGITTKDLTAKQTVKMIRFAGRTHTSFSLPTDALLTGYMIQSDPRANGGRYTVTVGDRQVGAYAHSTHHAADSLFLPIRAGESGVFAASQFVRRDDLYFVVVMFGGASPSDPFPQAKGTDR
ncbi:hypothetical protein ACQEVS_00585 [Streptomyces sp. CA-181903]|uniref:hypothetical protein n=1 Tax=Streptomyces sp. CA-181903 TaxID=3240055 RepID=UPI003D8A4F85